MQTVHNVVLLHCKLGALKVLFSFILFVSSVIFWWNTAPLLI